MRHEAIQTRSRQVRPLNERPSIVIGRALLIVGETALGLGGLAVLLDKQYNEGQLWKLLSGQSPQANLIVPPLVEAGATQGVVSEEQDFNPLASAVPNIVGFEAAPKTPTGIVDLTPTLRPTQTSTPLTEILILEDETQNINGYYLNVKMDINIISDTSLRDVTYNSENYHSVVNLHTNENGYELEYVNKFGELSEQALMHGMSNFFWRKWGIEKGDLKYYMSLWAKAKKTDSETDWQRVEFELLMNNPATPELDAQLITVNPGNVDIWVVDPDLDELKGRIVKIGGNRSSAWGWEIQDNGRLLLILGLDVESHRGDGRVSGNLTADLAKIFYFSTADSVEDRNALIALSASYPDRSKYPEWEIIGKDEPGNGWWGIFGFTPAHPVDKYGQ